MIIRFPLRESSQEETNENVKEYAPQNCSVNIYVRESVFLEVEAGPVGTDDSSRLDFFVGRGGVVSCRGLRPVDSTTSAKSGIFFLDRAKTPTLFSCS